MVKEVRVQKQPSGLLEETTLKENYLGESIFAGINPLKGGEIKKLLSYL